MRKALIFAYSDVNYDTRILKQCDALVKEGFDVSFYGVRYGNHDLKCNFKTKLYFKRAKKSSFQYLQYIPLMILFCMVQFRWVRHKPLIIVHNMPNFIIIPFYFSRIFGAKVILDIHDDSILAFKKYFNSSIFFKIIYWLEITVSLKIPKKIITVNSILAENLGRVVKKNIAIIHNSPNSFKKHKHTSYIIGSEIKLVYIGHLGSHYDLRTVIKYIDNIKEIPITFDIYGDGINRLDLEVFLAETKLIGKVRFHGRYLANDIPRILEKYDIGVALYEHSVFTNILLPVKILEYTQNGLPTITSPLVGTKRYFRDESLMFINNFYEFSESIHDIYNGKISMKNIHARALEDIIPLSWENESKEFIDFVVSNE